MLCKRGLSRHAVSVRLSASVLHRALVLVNAYKCAKFQLPSSISYGDIEGSKNVVGDITVTGIGLWTIYGYVKEIMITSASVELTQTRHSHSKQLFHVGQISVFLQGGSKSFIRCL